MALAPGTRLGPYEIVSPLGEGGMGEVYKARDTRLDRTVAVKVVNEQVAANPDLHARFEREARTISQLSHPHICQLFDVGSEGGAAFLVMEYLEGETLADRLRNGALPFTEMLRLGIEIASALDAAHRQGIVHRDLKPGNVMLTRPIGSATGTVKAKLLDFGLAKIGAPAGALSGMSMMPTTPANLTVQGAIVGTFQYMAPEQLEGRDADARTDIFAFGALLHEMATGRKAFEGATQVGLIGAILKDTPPPVSTVSGSSPPALDFVIRKCLAKSPEDRWQTARDLVSQLEWIAQGGGAHAPAATPVVRTSRVRERVAMAAAILFAGAAAGLGWLYFGSTPPAPLVTRLEFAPPDETPFPNGNAAPFPAISPDGRRIAFIVTKDGRGALAVRALDSVQIQVLAGTEGAGLPFWSPDSRFIGFFAEGKLKKVEVAGAPPQVLCNASAGEGGTWGGDGTILFAASDRTGLSRVSAAGGEPTSVTTLDESASENSHRWPWFLPDGRHFLFVSMRGRGQPAGGGGGGGRAGGPAAGPQANTEAETVAFVGSLDSTDRVRLFNSETKVAYSEGHLLFVRQGTLLAQPFDAAGLKTTGDAVPVAEDVGSNATNTRAAFAVSGNGVLAFRTLTTPFASTQLTLFDRHGQSLGDIGAAAVYAGIDATADGTRIAVHDHVDPGGGDVWLIDAVRGTKRRFTFDVDRHYAQPLWRPDESRVSYAANSGKLALLQKPSDGAGEDEVLLEIEPGVVGNFYITSWSRDGRYMLYQLPSPTTGRDIWALPLVGDRKPFPVLNTPFDENSAMLSPDGRWMLYSSNESRQLEIYVQPFPPSGGKWQISTAGGGLPRWRQDGREVYFLAPDRKLMAAEIRVEGNALKPGIPKALFDSRASLNGGINTIFYPYAVVKNGEQFVVATAEAERERRATPVTVVVNWTAGLRIR